MSLNWPDENYAKLYTRDTPNWLMMPWQARALLPLMIRKADGAGFIDTGDRELAALSLVVQLPQDVVQVGLYALVELGTVSRTAGGLELPNFVEAQEARKTEGQKKRDQRTKVRDLRRAEVRETVESPVPTLSPPSPQGVPLLLCSALPSSSSSSPSSSTPALPSSVQAAGKKAKKVKAQAELDVVPPKPPRELTVVQRLHAFFVEQRAGRLTDPLEDQGLGLPEAIADDPPKWSRITPAITAWLGLWPEETPEYQERFTRDLIAAYLKDPHWATATRWDAKGNDTGELQPYPLRVLLSEKVWRPLHEKLERELDHPAAGGVH